MATNYPGPYELRVFYSCAPAAFVSVTRQININLDLDGSPEKGLYFSEYDVIRREGVPVTLANLLAGFVAVFKPLLSSADSTVMHAELWKYNDLSFISEFYASDDISEAGTHAGAGEAAALTIFTWRTTEGGIMKQYLLEQPLENWQPTTYADLLAAQQDFVDWYTADATSFALGRDTSYPLAFLRRNSGQSENAFKRRFRP